LKTAYEHVIIYFHKFIQTVSQVFIPIDMLNYANLNRPVKYLQFAYDINRCFCFCLSCECSLYFLTWIWT